MFSIRIISIKGYNLFVSLLLSPSGKVARSADRGIFKISPYVAASPCLKKIQRTSFFSAKIVSLFHRLPLGGRLRRAAVVRGATCFLPELFQSRVATCSSASRSSDSCFPLREPLSNCRFKAISASKVARSADRGLFKFSPYVAASPCLHKILLYVKASPCFFLLSQKSAKIVSLFHSLPLGGEGGQSKALDE